MADPHIENELEKSLKILQPLANENTNVSCVVTFRVSHSQKGDVEVTCSMPTIDQKTLRTMIQSIFAGSAVDVTSRKIRKARKAKTPEE